MPLRVWKLKKLEWPILAGNDRKHTSTAMDRSYNLDLFMTLRVFEMSIFEYLVSAICQFFFRKSHLSSFSVSQEAPSENTRSGMRQPAEELDPKSGNSSRTIILTVFGSKDWRLSPTSAALYKSKQDKS